MERLTARALDGRAYVRGERAGWAMPAVRRLPELMEKLAAYEDTGLEPEEIAAGIPTTLYENIAETIPPLVQSIMENIPKVADLVTDALIKRNDRLLLVLAPGDVLFEADPEHGVVKHTVTDVHWVANTIAVDDSGQEWGDYYTDEEIETAYRTRTAAEAAMEG